MFCLCSQISVNSIMGNPDVEFLYFPFHGRGLVARLILDYGKADYNNKVLTFPEFGALKPSKSLSYIINIGVHQVTLSRGFVAKRFISANMRC